MSDDTNTEQPQAPAAMPWYRSKIIVAILTAVATQILARVKAKYHIDLTVFGVTADELVEGALDAITALAVTYATHARVTQKAAPQITLTKAAAVKATTTPSPSTQTPDKPAGA